MKERPILFSAPMVKALLSGDKTQTRRVIRFKSPYCKPPYDPYNLAFKSIPHPTFWDFGHLGAPGPCEHLECPYGKVGDRLRVKETWQPTVGILEIAREVPA